jgi:hypothetical protein
MLRFLAVLVALAAFSPLVAAQSQVELMTTAASTTTTGSGTICNGYWHDTRSQQVYLASDLTAAGIIPGLHHQRGRVPVCGDSGQSA